MTRRGRELVDRVVLRMWQAGQSLRGYEHDDQTIAIRVVTGARDGVRDPYGEAFFMAFGTVRERYLRARNARAWEWAVALRAWGSEVAAGTREVLAPERAGKVYQMPAAAARGANNVSASSRTVGVGAGTAAREDKKPAMGMVKKKRAAWSD